MKPRIAYIISDLNYAVAYEWIAKGFFNSEINIDFIFLSKRPPDLIPTIERVGFNCMHIELSEGKLQHFIAFKQLYKILSNGNYQGVHCHLFKANLLGLTVAKLLGIKYRVYTRHHATFHHRYHPKGVLMDRFINSLSTDIIAISKNVEHILLKEEVVSPKKVHYIPHGFDLGAFKEKDERKIDSILKRYGISKEVFRIGIIGRFIKLKGHRYIIDAFKSLHAEDPNTHLILANASGPDEHEIKLLLDSLKPASYTLINFEKDIFSLYHCFNAFVHVPIDERIEAFGQTYVEALAAGVPSVFTLSGIAPEFIVDRENALVVPFKNSQSIHTALKQLIEDEDLKVKMIMQGKLDVKAFSLKRMLDSLKALYKAHM